MTRTNGKGFATKHPGAAAPDPQLVAAITAGAKDNRLACAKAHEIAATFTITPAMVGQALDLMEYRISHCQLGLFGYGDKKKRITGTDPVPAPVREAIGAAAENSRLSCAKAWEIADNLAIGRLALANACEAMGIRIKPCQLGAF